MPTLAIVPHRWPPNLYLLEDCLFSRGLWLQCPLRVAQNGYLLIRDDKIKLYLILGDTVHVQLTTHLNQLTYTFEGAAQQQQAYYLAKPKQFPIELGQVAMAAGTSAKTLALFQHQLDSLTKAEVDFWQTYQIHHRLLGCFIRFETDAIRYMSVMLRFTLNAFRAADWALL